MILLLLVTSCSYSNQHVYKLYPGPERPDSDVVTLQFGPGVFEVIIDGMKVSRADYQQIKLIQGEHQINWGAEYFISVLIDADGFDQATTAHKALLIAGHTYTLNRDRTTGPGYEMYLWMTDDTTGKVVAGEIKP